MDGIRDTHFECDNPDPERQMSSVFSHLWIVDLRLQICFGISKQVRKLVMCLGAGIKGGR